MRNPFLIQKFIIDYHSETSIIAFISSRFVETIKLIKIGVQENPIRIKKLPEHYMRKINIQIRVKMEKQHIFLHIIKKTT